jgi:hypothetical protein
MALRLDDLFGHLLHQMVIPALAAPLAGRAFGQTTAQDFERGGERHAPGIGLLGDVASAVSLGPEFKVKAGGIFRVATALLRRPSAITQPVYQATADVRSDAGMDSATQLQTACRISRVDLPATLRDRLSL